MLYHHPSAPQYAVVTAMVILLRLSVIDTSWTHRIATLLLQRNNNSSSSSGSGIGSSSDSIAQRILNLLEDDEQLPNVDGGKFKPELNALKEGGQLSPREYLELCKLYHCGASGGKLANKYCYGILRITNLVNEETLQLLAESLKRDLFAYDITPAIFYLLQINSAEWKKEEYQMQSQLLIQTLKQLKGTCEKKAHFKKENDLIEQVLLKLQFAQGDMYQPTTTTTTKVRAKNVQDESGEYTTIQSTDENENENRNNNNFNNNINNNNENENLHLDPPPLPIDTATFITSSSDHFPLLNEQEMFPLWDSLFGREVC